MEREATKPGYLLVEFFLFFFRFLSSPTPPKHIVNIHCIIVYRTFSNCNIFLILGVFLSRFIRSNCIILVYIVWKDKYD